MNKIFITLFLLGNSLLAQDISLDEKLKRSNEFLLEGTTSKESTSDIFLTIDLPTNPLLPKIKVFIFYSVNS